MQGSSRHHHRHHRASLQQDRADRTHGPDAHRASVQQDRAERTHGPDTHSSKLKEQNGANSPTHQESQERRNYYLDLAGIDSSLTKGAQDGALNTTAPAAMLASPMATRRSHRKDYGDLDGPRSRSHHCSKRTSGSNSKKYGNVDSFDSYRFRCDDVSKRILTEENFEVLDKQLEKNAELQTQEEVQGLPVVPIQNNGHQGASQRSPVHTPVKKQATSPLIPKLASTPKGHRVRPVSLPGHIPETVSPHHHRRHRNRERNRKLAMQQVAEWIEREHSQSWTCGTKHVIVQKHEHHHTHEHHHHHHYHHYQET